MKKKIISLVILLAILFSLVGCKDSKDKSEYQIYYLNIEVSRIVPESCDLSDKGADISQKVQMLLEQMQSTPDDSKLRRTIPDSVKVLSHKENANCVIVDFSEGYNDMSNIEEVLVRAAVVRTLTQLDQVDSVSFTVNSSPLTDSEGNVIGSMNSESFVENPGEQINSSVEKTIVLYFADENGTGLKKQKRVIHYSSNILLEKLVVEQLIEGPKGSKLQRTLPAGTDIISISVVDGVCYVNFDGTFLNSINPKVTEDVMVYSIVNSLTSLDEVKKVEISIDGSNKGKFLYNYELDKMYEFKDSLIDVDE